jgi:hypothetical protein
MWRERQVARCAGSWSQQWCRACSHRHGPGGFAGCLRQGRCSTSAARRRDRETSSFGQASKCHHRRPSARKPANHVQPEHYSARLTCWPRSASASDRQPRRTYYCAPQDRFQHTLLADAGDQSWIQMNCVTEVVADHQYGEVEMLQDSGRDDLSWLWGAPSRLLPSGTGDPGRYRATKRDGPGAGFFQRSARGAASVKKPRAPVSARSVRAGRGLACSRAPATSERPEGVRQVLNEGQRATSLSSRMGPDDRSEVGAPASKCKYRTTHDKRESATNTGG